MFFLQVFLRCLVTRRLLMHCVHLTQILQWFHPNANKNKTKIKYEREKINFRSPDLDRRATIKLNQNVIIKDLLVRHYLLMNDYNHI